MVGQVMKRICIFLIYDNAGIVDRYIYYYLFELKKVAKIIIVVNGGIKEDGLGKLNNITNNIYIRNNATRMIPSIRVRIL